MNKSLSVRSLRVCFKNVQNNVKKLKSWKSTAVIFPNTFSVYKKHWTEVATVINFMTMSCAVIFRCSYCTPLFNNK